MNNRWDIENVIKLLNDIKKDNLRETNHFTKHTEENIPEISSVIDEYILCKKPVGILKQDDLKFKLYYELDDKYDLIVVISVKSENPTIISLITCFKQTSKRRVRKDDEKN